MANNKKFKKLNALYVSFTILLLLVFVLTVKLISFTSSLIQANIVVQGIIIFAAGTGIIISIIMVLTKIQRIIEDETDDQNHKNGK